MTKGLALLVLLAAPSLTRLPAAGGGVITVEADHFLYSFPNHRIEYTGNPVRLTRGDSTLTCKKLFVQLNQAEQVSKATYEDSSARLTCEGDPVVKSGGITAQGSLLVYDLQKDEVTMTDVHGEVPSADADAQVTKYRARHKEQASEGQR